MIAVGAIYVPVMRREIRSYIETWNSHRIRKQNNRPNVVVGKPNLLYMCPPTGTHNYQQPLSDDEYSRIWAETPAWDMDAILPLATQQWCDMQLEDLGLNPHQDAMRAAEDREAPFKEFYLQLRYRALLHIESGQQPILGLLAHPTGGWDFQVCTVLTY